MFCQVNGRRTSVFAFKTFSLNCSVFVFSKNKKKFVVVTGKNIFKKVFCLFFLQGSVDRLSSDDGHVNGNVSLF